MRNVVMRIALIFLAFFALSACDVMDETPTYRYRLTVEVDTLEGLKTGSSVIEVETDLVTNPESPAGNAIRWRLRGEAASVDLGERGTMFALLRSEQNAEWAKNIMFLLAPRGRNADGDTFLGTHANLVGMVGEHELPRTLGHINSALEGMSGLPMLVTFGDLDDPASVARVDPDDLASTFGQGVSLRRITVQITDDAVTNEIGDRLEWLSDYPEPSLKPGHDPRDFSLPASLHHGAFRKKTAL